jgi:DMSO/TMAO reductase YedYZ heme-binding membrane subunit
MTRLAPPEPAVPPIEAAGASSASAGPVDWLAAFGLCAAAFAFFWAYHDWWRGKPFSIATANEALALASVVGLSLALSADRLRALRGRGERLARLARTLLPTATLCALLHVGFALLLLPEKYDRAWQTAHPAMLGLGKAALVLLLPLCAATWSAVRRRLGERLGRRLHLGGLLTLALALLHFLVLGKFGRWAAWIRDLDHPAPPGTLPVFLIGLVPFVLAALTLRSGSAGPTNVGRGGRTTAPGAGPPGEASRPDPP